MDIIDIMLARAMTPQGQTETYVSIANAVATNSTSSLNFGFLSGSYISNITTDDTNLI